MLGIVRERGADGHAVGVFADRDVHAELVEQLVKLAVEAGHREPFLEPERPLLAAVGPHQQAVVHEVEVDLEADLGMVQPAGGQAAHVQVQGHVPPVVTRRGRGELHLADDLHPQVKGGPGRLPDVRPARGKVGPRCRADP
ncbi:MAG TPA: hypothetical protein VFP03_10385, partial [Jiangellaceae bacterium]|nr:hypothetical protein [Jiangellaceae bacterium]